MSTDLQRPESHTKYDSSDGFGLSMLLVFALLAIAVWITYSDSQYVRETGQSRLEAKYATHFTNYEPSSHGDPGYAQVDYGNCALSFDVVLYDGEEMLAKSMNGMEVRFSPSDFTSYEATCPDLSKS